MAAFCFWVSYASSPEAQKVRKPPKPLTPIALDNWNLAVGLQG
jgi:hypothetical protein